MIDPASSLSWVDQPERHPVTVMFADIEASTEMVGLADAETAAELLDPVILVMVEATERYNGVVGHRGDGIMATFGTPSVCEDHALRACLAALAIREHLVLPQYRDIRVRIGIHSGEVVVSRMRIGGGSIPQVSGGAVHVAARLEQTTLPGTICLSAAAHALVRPYVHAQNLLPVTVKGLAAPVERMELIGLQQITDRWRTRMAAGLRPLIGRDGELAALIGMLGSRPGDDVRVARIIGPAGIGKSRLLHELVTVAEARGRTVARLAGDQHRRHVPFNAIMDWLREVSGVGLADSAEQARARIAAAVAAAAADDPDGATDAVERMLGVGARPHPIRQASPSAADLRRLERAAAALLLARAGAGGMLIACEDIDQFDAASADLLCGLCARLTGHDVLVVATSRRRVRLGIGRHTRIISLQPLSRSDTLRLLQAIHGSGPACPALMAAVADKAGGNPLFVEEVAALMRDSDRPGAPDDAARDLQIPDRVRSLIADRLARLQPDQRHLLQRCAVFGLDVPVDGLARLLGVSPGEASRRLAKLAAAQVLVETRRYPDAQFRFAQRLVRDVAYRTLLISLRRELHARIVAALEGGAVPRRLDDLVLHAQAAGLWQIAITYLRQSADEAVQKFAYATAAAQLRRALAIARDRPPDEALLRTRLAIALEQSPLLTALGLYPEMAVLLDEARTLAERLGNPDALVRVMLQRVHVHNILGELHEAVSLAREVVTRARGLDDAARRVAAEHFLGQALFNIGALREAAAVLAEAADRCADLPIEAGVAGSPGVIVCATRCLTLSFLGELDTAAAAVATGLMLAARSGRPYDLALIRSTEGFMLTLRRAPAEATAAIESGLRCAEAAGIEQLALPLRVALGQAQLLGGAPAMARETFLASLQLARERRRLMMQIWAASGLALAELTLGRLQEAHDVAWEALALAERSRFRAFEAICQRTLGQVLLQLPGRHADAIALLHQALATAEAIGMRPEADLAQASLTALDEARLTFRPACPASAPLRC